MRCQCNAAPQLRQGRAVKIKAKGTRLAMRDGRLLDEPAKTIDPFNPRGLTFADLDEVARLEILAIPERLQQLAAEAYKPEPL